MSFQENFVFVGRNQMVDPVLRLRIRRGRFELDGPNQWITVEYDPEIRPDRLMVKMTAKDIRDFQLGEIPLPANRLIPFESELSRDVYSVNFYEEWRGEILVLRCPADSVTLVDDQRFFQGKLKNEPEAVDLRARSIECIDYIMRNILKYYEETDRAFATWRRRPKHMQLILRKEYAEQLPSCVAKQLNHFDDYVIFDAREMAQ